MANVFSYKGYKGSINKEQRIKNIGGKEVCHDRKVRFTPK